MRLSFRFALLCLLPACAASRFHRFDKDFVPKRSAQPPAVIEANRVPKTHRGVGEIKIAEVYEDDVQALVEKARRQGQELGCDLVLHVRHTERKLIETESSEVALVPWNGGGRAWRAAENEGRFICAISREHTAAVLAPEPKGPPHRTVNDAGRSGERNGW